MKRQDLVSEEGIGGRGREERDGGINKNEAAQKIRIALNLKSSSLKGSKGLKESLAKIKQ